MAQVTATLGTDENLQITRVDPNKNHPIPPYFTLGRYGKSRHRIEGFDVPLIMMKLSGKSSWLFWFFVSIKDIETNMCDVTKQHYMTKTEKARIPRAYEELLKMKLVIRFSRGKYLINPKAVLPTFSRFEATWDKWVNTCNRDGVPFE